eukprot:1885076-Rhodomonas_salina.1
MSTSLDGEIIGQLAFSIAALRGHLEAGHVNEGWFNLYGRHTTERPIQDNDGNVTALQMRVELIDTDVRRPEGASRASAAGIPGMMPQPMNVGGQAPQAEGGTMTVDVVGVRNLPTIGRGDQQKMLDPIVLCILGEQVGSARGCCARVHDNAQVPDSQRDVQRALLVQPDGPRRDEAADDPSREQRGREQPDRA